MKYSRRTSIGSRSTASNRLFMGSQPFRGRDVCWKTDVVTFWNLFDFHSPRHLQVWVDRLRPTVITLNTVWHLCWFVIEHSTAHWFALTNRTVFPPPHSEPAPRNPESRPKWKMATIFSTKRVTIILFCFSLSLSLFVFRIPKAEKTFCLKVFDQFPCLIAFFPFAWPWSWALARTAAATSS